MYRTQVALLAEGVDRNIDAANMALANTVALLAEGVDRNKEINALFNNIRKVALLAEGVDRNRLHIRSSPC